MTRPSAHCLKCLTCLKSHVSQVLSAGLELVVNMLGRVDRRVETLIQAAGSGHVEVMQALSEAGVEDTGEAMAYAIKFRQRNSIMFLMKQYDKSSLRHVSTLCGASLLFHAIDSTDVFEHFAPKLVRWLMDAGANTKAPVVLLSRVDHRRPSVTAQEYVRSLIGSGHLETKSLHVIAVLLKQEEAVHAVSWLWPLKKSKEKSKKKPNPLLVGIVRRSRRETSLVVVGGLMRYTRKKD